MINKIKISYEPSEIEDFDLDNYEDLINSVRKMFNPDTINLFEEGIIILLDTTDRVIGFDQFSKGDSEMAIINTRILFNYVYAWGASRFILAHNHPDNYCVPSEGDIQTTMSIKGQCDFLGIGLYDHVIITRDNYYSFGAHGFI